MVGKERTLSRLHPDGLVRIFGKCGQIATPPSCDTDHNCHLLQQVEAPLVGVAGGCGFLLAESPTPKSPVGHYHSGEEGL